MTMKEKMILIVEDEKIIAEDIKMTLWNFGFQRSEIVSNGNEALDFVSKHSVDLILMDIVLDGSLTGIEVAEKIRQTISVPIIYITGYSDKRTLDRAKITIPNGFLIKPYDEKELIASVEMAFYRYDEEKALITLNKRWKGLTDLLPQTIFEVDLYENVTYMNKFGLDFFGFTPTDFEEKRLNLLSLLLPESKDNFQTVFQKILTKQVVSQRHFILKNQRGEKFYTLIYMNLKEIERVPSGVRGIIVDVTKEKKMEKQLLQTERLAGISHFAKGIAHDIRKPLMNINESAQFLSANYQADTEIVNHLEIIKRNSESVNRIVTELLDFSNPKEMQKQPIEIETIINKVLHLVQPKLKHQQITVEKDFAPFLSPLPLDKNWMEQVFLNLFLNSIEAMSTGGSIFIKVVENQSESIQEIYFDDTGIGLDKQQLDTIFAPFFTTKPNGIGLGLSVVYQIVQAHDGEITMESEINNGMRIKISFPLSKKG